MNRLIELKRKNSQPQKCRAGIVFWTFLVLSPFVSGSNSWSAILAPTLIEVSGGEQVSEWIAMAHSVRSKNIDVVGIVIASPGEDSKAYQLATQLREILNRPDIPMIHAVSESVPDCQFELWKGENAPTPETEDGDLASQVSDLIDAHSGNLQILSLGSLQGLTAAWEKDPTSLSKLRRILISGVTLDQDVLAGISGIEGKAGHLLLASTVPLALFPESVNRTIRFTKENQISLARARTPLTDALTYLVANQAHASGDGEKAWQEGIPFDHSLMVTYAFHPRAATLEKRKVSVGSAAGNQIEAMVASDCKKDLIIGNLIFNFIDPMTDFGLGFSHYLFNLGRLSDSTKKLVSEKLKNLPAPKEIQDASAVARERVRRILDYLESSIHCFDGIEGDPTADAATRSLLDTYQKVASIGWHFPDSFYTSWSVDVAENGEFGLQCGVSNPHGRDLTGISVSSSLETKALPSEHIDSATGDVTYHLVGGLPNLTVGRQFECAGIACSSTITLEISGIISLELSRRE